MIMDRDREHLLGVILANDVGVEDLADLLRGVGTLSPDFLSKDLFSSPMMSRQSSTHSSQMKTVGPAISLRTACWLSPQTEQYKGFFESLPPILLISEPPGPHRSGKRPLQTPLRPWLEF